MPTLSRKLLYVFIIVLLATILVYNLGQSSTSRGLLPDVFLPWNSPPNKVVQVLDQIYQYKGQKTKWAMCETDVPGLFQMCLKDKDKAGPFTFIFTENKLTGYIAEFPDSKYDQLVRSGKNMYVSRGIVKSASREFRVYEMQIMDGYLELFMVYDKDSHKVRLQTKYKYLGKDKTDVEEPVLEDNTEPNVAIGMIDYLNILTFDPISSKSTRSMTDLSKRLTIFVLVKALSPIN